MSETSWWPSAWDVASLLVHRPLRHRCPNSIFPFEQRPIISCCRQMTTTCDPRCLVELVSSSLCSNDWKLRYRFSCCRTTTYTQASMAASLCSGLPIVSSQTNAPSPSLIEGTNSHTRSRSPPDGAVAYQHRLISCGIQGSMGRSGNCWDYAVVESFLPRWKPSSCAAVCIIPGKTRAPRSLHVLRDFIIGPAVIPRCAISAPWSSNKGRLSQPAVSTKPREVHTPHAALMTGARLRLAFPIMEMESLEESHPLRLPPWNPSLGF